MKTLKLKRRIGAYSKSIIIYSREEYVSLLNMLETLTKLGIKAERATSKVERNHSDEWELCEYCETPLCECDCEGQRRFGQHAYPREYDDDASLED